MTELRAARESLRQAEMREEALADALKLAIGERSGLSIAGQAVVTWKAAKDSTRTDWEAVAAALQPPPELIAVHTVTKPGSRRFIVKG